VTNAVEPSSAVAVANVPWLLESRSVAIVGDSPGEGRGGWIHEALLGGGFDGAVYPVNPKYDNIRGRRAYRSLLDLPDRVDFVAVAVGAAHAVGVVEQAGQIGAKAVLCIAAGFAEAGVDGRRAQDELAAAARRHGIALCGPNCYGIANLHAHFLAYGGPLAAPMTAGPVALLFQSGALTHSVTDPLVQRGVGFSFIVTSGNEAVVELADYIDVVADDPNTSVIACFVEGFKHPARFESAARKAAANGKRIVVLKVGRTELGRRAALAHTGSVAGEDRVYDALFEQLGVVRVDDLDELIETATLLSRVRRIDGRNIGIVTISGGGSGVISDLAEDVALPLRPFTATTEDRLRAELPVFAHPNNPLDVTGAVGERPELMRAALEALARDEEVGAVVLALNSPTATDEISRALHRSMVTSLAAVAGPQDVPFVLLSMTSGALDLELRMIAEAAGVPFLCGLREGLAAIARTANGRLGAPADAGTPPDGVRGLMRPPFGETAAKTVLELIGLHVPRAATVSTPEEAAREAEAIGFPVVLKIDSPDVPHKTEAGAVVVDVRDRAGAEAAFAQIVANARAYAPGAEIETVSVQEHVPDGVDFLIGVTAAEGLGPAVVLSVGGVFVEALDDAAVAMAPLTEAGADRMIDSLRGSRLLDGYRGRPRADRDALRDALVRLSKLAWWLRDDIVEIDVNPLRVLAEGEGAVVLDALFVPHDPSERKVSIE
jgi:acetyltransferase